MNKIRKERESNRRLAELSRAYLKRQRRLAKQQQGNDKVGAAKACPAAKHP